MFKAVSRYLKKTSAVSALFAMLLAIALLATASAADAAAGTVTTTHWKSSTAEGYTLNFVVPNTDANIDTVTLTAGPGITTAIPLTVVVAADGSTSYTYSLELSTPPVLNDSYTLNVVYLEQAAPPEAITASVTGVLNSFATPVAPLGGVASAANPVFSWSAPATPPAGAYQYIVSVSGGDGLMGQSAPISSSVLTYTSTIAPTSGIPYDWAIVVVDANGNRSESRTASFMVGANFQGKVTTLANAGVSGVSILVFNSLGQAQVHDTVLTQADGSYIYGGLVAGSYKIAFSKGTGSLLYYNNKFLASDADLVSITNGVVTTGINAVIDTWGAIAGKAVTAAGAGISGLKVETYDANGVLLTSVPAVTTKTDGTFLVSLLPPGSYKVKLSGVAQGYAEQWANSGFTINVSAGDSTDLLNTVMPKINLTGTVTDTAGNPVAGVWIWLYTDKAGSFANFSGVQTQADGSYAVGGMAGGTYYLLFDTTGTSFQKQYYNRKASLTLADPVTIGTTALSGINAVVGTGTPVITGFTVPATSASFTVSGITLTAVEGNGVAGYMLTETPTPPEVTTAGWSATAPTSYKFTTIGDKILYAWAKGSTGLISASAQQPVTISAAAMKTGDCDGSGLVTIAEVQSAINMYLGMKAIEQCVDQDNSGTTSIAEVQKAINSFLGL